MLVLHLSSLLLRFIPYPCRLYFVQRDIEHCGIYHLNSLETWLPLCLENESHQQQITKGRRERLGQSPARPHCFLNYRFVSLRPKCSEKVLIQPYSQALRINLSTATSLCRAYIYFSVLLNENISNITFFCPTCWTSLFN